jgi:hypothetical protein
MARLAENRAAKMEARKSRFGAINHPAVALAKVRTG